MKRAALGILILSLIALPTFAAGTYDRGLLVTHAQCVSLDHVTGGWRMEIKCDQSKGTIVLVDRGKQIEYVGEGLFRGWSQSELMALYQSLIPKVDSNFEVMQLG
jgi:hypothetical protein